MSHDSVASSLARRCGVLPHGRAILFSLLAALSTPTIQAKAQNERMQKDSQSFFFSSFVFISSRFIIQSLLEIFERMPTYPEILENFH